MKLLHFLDCYIDEMQRKKHLIEEAEARFFMEGGIASLICMRDIVLLAFPNTNLIYIDDPDGRMQ